MGGAEIWGVLGGVGQMPFLNYFSGWNWWTHGRPCLIVFETLCNCSDWYKPLKWHGNIWREWQFLIKFQYLCKGHWKYKDCAQVCTCMHVCLDIHDGRVGDDRMSRHDEQVITTQKCVRLEVSSTHSQSQMDGSWVLVVVQFVKTIPLSELQKKYDHEELEIIWGDIFNL